MKKTIKILSLFLLTSIFIISCDNKKKKDTDTENKTVKNKNGNEKDDKKDDKKEELTEKEVDFINYADLMCRYQEARAEERQDDLQKINTEAQIMIKDIEKKYGDFETDPEVAEIVLNEIKKCQEAIEKNGEWDAVVSELQRVINQNMLPEGGEDDEYYDEDEYYEEGDEYYDEDEYYEEEGEGPPGGDWARYEELIEEGYSSEEAIKIMQDEY